MEPRHVLIVTFPAQGHVNPSLSFAKRLVSLNIKATLVTSLSGRKRIENSIAAGGIPKDLNFAYFSDGFDAGFKLGDDMNKLKVEMRNGGKKTLRDIISQAEKEGNPITCLVYTLLLSWATEVAREVNLPVALLWIQPAAVLGIYYYYFNGFKDEITSNCDDPAWKLELPGYPFSFSSRDLPSFLIPSSSSLFAFSALQSFEEQFECLDKEKSPKILVNTFDELEVEILRSFCKYKLIGIGPLIQDSVFNKKPDQDYFEWLDSNPEASVIYVSFGSILSHSKGQMGEIAKGLMRTKRSFLWVVTGESNDQDNDEDYTVTMNEIQKFGKIVSWCDQLEVLRHPSLGCFVSHCGWNSTLESLHCGVPMVAFPHWTDQGTNAKLIEDVWEVGVRVKVNDEKGIVLGEEMSRCIEEVMDGGEICKKVRDNCKKWKTLAREVVDKNNGSSYKNLVEFTTSFVDGNESF